MKPSYFSSLLPNVFIFGKRDKLSCSASAVISLSIIVESLLSTLHASVNSILHCEANFAPAMWAASLFSSRAVALVSCISRLCHSRACALPLLNLKKMRDCSQSRIGLIIWQPVEPNKIMKYYNRLSASKKDKIWNKYKIILWSYCPYIYLEFLSIIQYDDVISLCGNSRNNGPHGTHKKSFKMVQFFPCTWKVFPYYKGICYL